MTTQTKMYSSCVEWLDDWTQELPPLLDTFDVVEWMEGEMIEAVQDFLRFAFRKTKTRTEAIEIMRTLLWELFLFCRDTAIRHIPADSGEQVQRLLALPQTAQKSAAWHAEARNLLTGHEFAAVVYGTENARQAVIAKKCVTEAVIDDADMAIESRIVYTGTLSAFQWGWRFESVIRDLFEMEIAGGKVDDSLGRIRHPVLPRLAASPDGLICNGQKAGRLVEIKAPYSRSLTGTIPSDYYCQMQLQAEVTGSPAVEYIEVRFDARDHTVLMGDPDLLARFLTPSTKSIPRKMGAVLVVAPSEEAAEDSSTWKYVYSPIVELGQKGYDEVLVWKPADFGEEAVILERSIWKVYDWWTTTVPRNQRWWSEIGQPAYEDFWVDVDEARASGKYKSQLLIVDDEEEETEEVDAKPEKKSNLLIVDSD